MAGPLVGRMAGALGPQIMRALKVSVPTTKAGWAWTIGPDVLTSVAGQLAAPEDTSLGGRAAILATDLVGNLGLTMGGRILGSNLGRRQQVNTLKAGRAEIPVGSPGFKQRRADLRKQIDTDIGQMAGITEMAGSYGIGMLARNPFLMKEYDRVGAQQQEAMSAELQSAYEAGMQQGHMLQGTPVGSTLGGAYSLLDLLGAGQLGHSLR